LLVSSLRLGVFAGDIPQPKEFPAKAQSCKAGELLRLQGEVFQNLVMFIDRCFDLSLRLGVFAGDIPHPKEFPAKAQSCKGRHA
jgi:hypothetical protein